MPTTTTAPPLAAAKPWWKSLTLWGLAFTALFTVMSQQGFDVPELPPNPDTEQLKEVYNEVKEVKDKKGDVGDYLLQAGKWLGVLLSVYGRLRSKTQVTSSSGKADTINEAVHEVATSSSTAADVGLKLPTVVKEAGAST